jgi:Kef-type K+ transport system membrane component KefB
MAIGTLMNARGLMELIILNIGLERGIIEPTLFTIMVLMAVVTTLMATPIFERIYGRKELRTT